MRNFLFSALLLVCAAALGAGAAGGNKSNRQPLAATAGLASSAAASPAPVATDENGFRFVRVKYEPNRRSRWGTPPWKYDYPTAEENLYVALERTTNIHLEGPPIVLSLKDEEIFEYPILYLCEPGYWLTDEEEIENLRAYLARGGFIIIDDFHDQRDPEQRGPQWDNFYHNFKQVFPDREPVELDRSHPIWSIYYDIDPEEAVSAKLESGEVPWLDKYSDRYYGIFDDSGRMLSVICYNQDIGDGWEWPGRNLQDASTVSFQMAVNFIMYALTH